MEQTIDIKSALKDLQGNFYTAFMLL